MTEIKAEENQVITEELGLVPFHFDVPDHRLPLNQFIDTAKSTQAIIDNFNKEFFDSKLKYQIHVVTPREGGLIEILQVVVPVAAPIWAFLSTEIGKAYIKGLTGKEPVYWAEKAGEKTKEYLSDENGGPIEMPDQKEKEEVKKPPETQEEKKTAAIIVVQITLGFLQKEPDELRRLGLSKEKFREAYHARNKIYQGCIGNKEVKGLGFDETHSFPIKRKDFPRYIVDVPPDDEEKETDDNQQWVVDTPDIIVNSPNWKRDGRKWQAETTKFKDIAFSIEDETFWHHVKIKDIQPDINDNMKVQWAYPEGALKPSNVRVLKVLSYNGKKISDPLTPEELAKELQDYSVREKEHPDLFDEIHNIENSRPQLPNRKTG